jgi:hypothetical protein
MRLAGPVARIGEMKIYIILIGKPEAKIPLGNLGVNGIRMYIRELYWKYVYLVHLAEDKDQWRAVVNTRGLFD